MISFYRLMMALSLLTPSLSFADQMWDHKYTPLADLEVIYEQSQGNCPRTIRIETNDDNEIYMHAEGGFFSVISAYGIMDGKSRSINGFNTSFKVSNSSLLVTSIHGSSGWGANNFTSLKVKMALTRDKSTGQYSAELEHHRKESLVGFYHLEDTASCKFKNVLTP
ncbi:hypothetical protein [Bdellovibrio sp. HCB337]|uniref:hypothetical protein n=1 Tax=Bdellovibrio sp. HCB337 TaxID=3394358 RepID=UPI0039A5129C